MIGIHSWGLTFKKQVSLNISLSQEEEGKENNKNSKEKYRAACSTNKTG